MAAGDVAVPPFSAGAAVVLGDSGGGVAGFGTVDAILARADKAAESACDFAYHADAIAAIAASPAITALIHATFRPAAACVR